jgi:hypothetical protein
MSKHVLAAAADEGDDEDGDGHVIPAPSISDVIMQREDALPSPSPSSLDMRAGGDGMTTCSRSRSNVQNV